MGQSNETRQCAYFFVIPYYNMHVQPYLQGDPPQPALEEASCSRGVSSVAHTPLVKQEKLVEQCVHLAEHVCIPTYVYCRLVEQCIHLAEYE